MSTSSSGGNRKYAVKPFWEKNAFWFVGLPTTLVAFVFLLGMVSNAIGQ